MIEDSNVRLLEAAFKSWNVSKGASVDEWMALMAEDVKFYSLADGAPDMEFTATCCGKKDLARYFSGLTEQWEMLHYTVDDYIAQGDRVVALSHVAFRHKVAGKSLESRKADVVRLKDSKIVEFSGFYDTAQALSAAHSE